MPNIVAAEGNIYCQREDKIFASTRGRVHRAGAVRDGLRHRGDGRRRGRGAEPLVSRTASAATRAPRAGSSSSATTCAGNAQRVAEEASALLRAKTMAPGTTTVILDGSQVALQIHESCGHPIELDRVLGTEAAFAGTSFLTTDKLGTLHVRLAVGEHDGRRDDPRRPRHLRLRRRRRAGAVDADRPRRAASSAT